MISVSAVGICLCLALLYLSWRSRPMKILIEILSWDRRDPEYGEYSWPPLLRVIASVAFLVLAALSYRSKLVKSVLDYFINN